MFFVSIDRLDEMIIIIPHFSIWMSVGFYLKLLTIFNFKIKQSVIFFYKLC